MCIYIHIYVCICILHTHTHRKEIMFSCKFKDLQTNQELLKLYVCNIASLRVSYSSSGWDFSFLFASRNILENKDWREFWSKSFTENLIVSLPTMVWFFIVLFQGYKPFNSFIFINKPTTLRAWIIRNVSQQNFVNFLYIIN